MPKSLPQKCFLQKGLHRGGFHFSKNSLFFFSDPQSKIKAICKCQKLCHMKAVENAFSKVLLVVLGNGKVSVEIDTTKPDFHSDNMPDEQLVKVVFQFNL